MTSPKMESELPLSNRVDESAFWHTNIDLTYGYQIGEVVEIEHEPNKYWLASIRYVFRNLLLIRWVGETEDFWLDIGNGDLSSRPNVQSNIPRRLFALGHHLQAPMRSHYILERPSSILIRPSLYDPSTDPYANIESVDDLLKHEVDLKKDVFADISARYTDRAATSKIPMTNSVSFGQEDVDELEAALQNLNDQLEPGAMVHETDDSVANKKTDQVDAKPVEPVSSATDTGTNPASDNTDATRNKQAELADSSPAVPEDTKLDTEAVIESESNTKGSESSKEQDCETKLINICRGLQNDAIDLGRIFGLDDNSTKVYFPKPKQFYESGGISHERLLVPGTILEACYSYEGELGLELAHWFIVILKNTGGRLTLRWFVSDQPKFKQGRIELKTLKTDFIKEDDDENDDDDENNPHENKSSSDLTKQDGETNQIAGQQQPKRQILAKDITFRMHYCNPCLYNFSYAETETHRKYKPPNILYKVVLAQKGQEETDSYFNDIQRNHLFNVKRLSLDVNRYCIRELFCQIRWLRPKYLDLAYAPKDEKSSREILISTASTLRLVRGFVKREIERGVFEINSAPTNDDETGIIKFVYPFDSSFGVLPISWAENNADCLRSPLGAGLNETTDNQGILQDQSEQVPGKPKIAPEQEALDDGHSQIDLNSSQLHGNDQKLLACEWPIRVGPMTLMSEIPIEKNLPPDDDGTIPSDCLPKLSELDPLYWSRLIRRHELNLQEFKCALDRTHENTFYKLYKNMKQVEVVHPSSDSTICEGRIRKAVYPLLWIQISADSYTVLPFTSSNIYPVDWCATYDHSLVALLPACKKLNITQQVPTSDKKRKRAKLSHPDGPRGEGNSDSSGIQSPSSNDQNCELDDEETKRKQEAAFENENKLDLHSLNDKQLDIDYITNEKSSYITVYFNHKCFTGPALSKGKICSLPQYVGPGPLRLVMEEVVTKLISVAYVPPRILNDLNSQTFRDLLVARNLTNTIPVTFKAKYQKRVHREEIPVCLKLKDVVAYCECMCEHLKCCYNLFGPNLYDGDDCPGHCRALTKSNKFMKRATYYREKARNGEFINDSQSNSKKSNQNNHTGSSNSNVNNQSTNNDASNKPSRPRYGGRDSFESVSSRSSRSELVNSRASSAGGEDNLTNGALKENLGTVEEAMDTSETPDSAHDLRFKDVQNNFQNQDLDQEIMCLSNGQSSNASVNGTNGLSLNTADLLEHQNNTRQVADSLSICKQAARLKLQNSNEFAMLENIKNNPRDWAIDDVAQALESCGLSQFKHHLISEGVDGGAILLLDKSSIREHFQQLPKMDFNQDEMGKFCRFVEYLKIRQDNFE